MFSLVIGIGQLIFLGIFFIIITIIVGTVSLAIYRTIKELKK